MNDISNLACIKIEINRQSNISINKVPLLYIGVLRIELKLIRLIGQ